MCIEEMKDYIREFLDYAEPSEVEAVYCLLVEEVMV